MSNDYISNFIADVCYALDIEVPKVSHAIPEIWCTVDGNTIFIPEIETPDPELLYSVAYQLRIRWQFSTNSDYFNYQIIDESDNDNSISEIDANAFAALYMISYMNLMSMFTAKSPRIRESIIKRMNEILDE